MKVFENTKANDQMQASGGLRNSTEMDGFAKWAMLVGCLCTGTVSLYIKQNNKTCANVVQTKPKQQMTLIQKIR